MENAKFSLRAPEEIAKFYGGNKQKILQALQSGALQKFAPPPMDQTLAAAAAGFIDEMRNAAQAEAVPQQTVFEKLFAPPAAPMGQQPMPTGLGAAPQMAAMMPTAPTNPAVPMPPPGGQGMAPQAPMAMMAGGGLAGLYVPDDMFDEPTNGGYDDGYAGGGLIAFAKGAYGEEQEEEEPDFAAMLAKNIELVRQGAPQDTTYANKLMDMYKNILSDESLKKRQKQDMWAVLGQLGAKMASTPGSFLQAASAGMAEAIPAAQEAAKLRRDEQREATKAMAAQESVSNKQARELYGLADDLTRYQEGRMDAKEKLRFEDRWRTEENQTRLLAQQIAADATRYAANKSASAQRDVGLAGLAQTARQAAIAAQAQIPDQKKTPGTPLYLANSTFLKAVKKFGEDSEQAATASANLQAAEKQYIASQVGATEFGYSSAIDGGNNPSREGFSAEPIQ